MSDLSLTIENATFALEANTSPTSLSLSVPGTSSFSLTIAIPSEGVYDFYTYLMGGLSAES